MPMQQSRISQIAESLKPDNIMEMESVESPDIDDRISWMIEEINEGKRDPRIRQIAGDILGKKTKDDQWAVPERDWLGEIKAVFDYVRKNVRFTRDPHDLELFQKPRRTLETKIADCDDLTILSCALLQSIGYPVFIRVIGINSKSFSHVYLLVAYPPHEPKQVTPFDASRGEGVGWELKEGVTVKRDYEVTEE